MSTDEEIHTAFVQGEAAVTTLFYAVAGQVAVLAASVTQAVQYGPAAHTWAAYFTKQHHVPVERTTVIFADVVQHRVSEAAVLKASEHLDRCIEPSTVAVQAIPRAQA